MATVEKLGGNWVIVRGRGTNASDETGNSVEPQEPALSSDREFWTGDGWAAQYGFAKQFATQEEAEDYLDQHRQEMA
jgi:hypothetical protein